MIRWFIGLFHYDTPYDHPEAAHPLFAVAARRVRWVNSPDALRGYQRRAAWGVSAVVLGVGALLTVLFWLGDMRLVSAMFTSLLILIGASVVIGLLVDFFCVLYGMNSVSSLDDADMSDFLRVTAVNPLTLMAARLRLARLYAWRAFILLALMRMTLLAMLAGAVVVGLLALSTDADWHIDELLLAVGAALGGMVTITVFLLREPYWRYHAMTAIGVQQAAEHLNPFRRAVFVVLAVIGFWMLQGMVLLMGGYAMGMGVAMLGAILMSLTDVYLPDVVIGGIVLVIMLVAALLPLAYLWIVRHVMMDYVPARSLTRSGRRFLGWDDEPSGAELWDSRPTRPRTHDTITIDET